jgi:hypothetical protein
MPARKWRRLRAVTKLRGVAESSFLSPAEAGWDELAIRRPRSRRAVTKFAREEAFRAGLVARTEADDGLALVTARGPGGTPAVPLLQGKDSVSFVTELSRLGLSCAAG